MPDSPTEHHRAAAEAIGTMLTRQYQATPLDQRDLAAYPNRSVAAGWRLSVMFSDQQRRIDVLITLAVPFSPPLVALVDRPPTLTWPHLEEDGMLCLDSGSITVDFRNPCGVADFMLKNAYRLIEDNITGTTRHDFLDEFQSYWTRASGCTGIPYLSLLRPNGPTRMVRVWRGNDQVIVADEHESLARWYKHRFGPSSRPIISIPAAFVWLNRPLYPSEYPGSAREFQSIADALAPGSIATLAALAAATPERAAVILGATSKNGPCMAAIEFPSPATIKFEGHSRKPRLAGFRPEQAPIPALTDAYFGRSIPVVKSNVARVDASWAHGRDHDERQRALNARITVIVGCGSIGGGVAVLLAQAGIGRIIVIDPETLTWANIGRHPLGAGHVGKQKASSLAGHLQRNYPHLTIEARDKTWEQVRDEDSRLFLNANLVINTSGSWTANAAMNTWQRGEQKPQTILYGWTEAHACAGHAIAIGIQGACLECGLDQFGKPVDVVTLWPEEDTQRQEPACGARFQPYGAVELASTVQLIAQAALDLFLEKRGPATHWVYAGRNDVLSELGGAWNPDWINGDLARLQGGFTAIQPWPSRTSCPGSH